eukprot:gb/GECG01009014.1/.p1 GENE.gb/GECG01009014.1/~~gb/GECG01009014.1/.p1  ORF type:complete len:132 (+),score=10.88 gb/GECG01009014.1/:1-396(+)
MFAKRSICSSGMNVAVAETLENMSFFQIEEQNAINETPRDLVPSTIEAELFLRRFSIDKSEKNLAQREDKRRWLKSDAKLLISSNKEYRKTIKSTKPQTKRVFQRECRPSRLSKGIQRLAQERRNPPKNRG